MGPSPLLDAGHLVGAAADGAVAIHAEPPTLAGGFAGAAAIRFRAILLAINSSRVREEKAAATAALGSARRAAHRQPDAGSKRTGGNSKKAPAKKTKAEEGSRASGRRAGGKRSRRKRIFRPAAFPRFHSAADTFRAAPLIALSQPFQLLVPTDRFQLHCLRSRVTFSREATTPFPPPPNKLPGNIYFESTRGVESRQHWALNRCAAEAKARLSAAGARFPQVSHLASGQFP
ncbi:MAG TPA: hypothetical protein DCE44_07850 [Verrucomicrobiales bacterium]|nr:hypothetical protein [Verrucomicrobiales bacterium]